MRFAPSAPEQALWRALSGRRLGISFRRQVPIGGRYITDIVAPAARLVIEVDGPHHAHRRRADACRDDNLRALGYRVLRLEAQLVLRELPLALARIREALEASL
jgi:very-short-patch-repair endonuclease